MNILKKCLAIFLCFVTVFGCVRIAYVPAEAAEDGITIRINELRTKFPHKKFWNHYVTKSSEAGLSASKNEAFADSVTSSPCASHNANAKVGQYECNYFDGGIQCWGFAVKVFYDIFGVRASKMPKKYDIENIKVGDYLRFGTDSDGHSAVVIARNGNTLTLVEGNYHPSATQAGIKSTLCYIYWDRKVNINTVSYYKRASNYDTVKNSVNRTLDINVSLNGTAYNNGHDNVTFDLYVNDKLVANDVKDHKGSYAHNSSYSIKDIKVTGCFQRENENAVSGKLAANTTVTLPITEKHTPVAIPAVAAQCTETGLSVGEKCSACGKVLKAQSVVAATGHKLTESVIPATCISLEKLTHTCSQCNFSKTVTAPSLFTGWSTSTAPADAVETETKTQYRSSERVEEWTVKETGTTDYAVSWPAGFDKSNSLYTKYNKTPVKASETDTEKTVVTTSNAGYLYWHWCRGDYTSGPINRKIGDAKNSTYDTFHAFFSTTDAATVTDSNARKYANGSACKDSYWWIISRVDIKRCTYTKYVRTSTDGWGEWSEWQDEKITPSDNLKVETRTLSKWVNPSAALFASHQWSEWTTVLGVATRTCNVCKKTESKTAILLGDCDFNAKVEVADARIALRVSVGLDKSTAKLIEAGDVDKDGTITVADARRILRCSVGLEKLS